MKHLTIFFIVVLFANCQNPALDIQKDLEEARKEIESLKKELNGEEEEEKELIHLVYFKLKEGLGNEEKETFKSGLESLEKIEFVKDLEIGVPADSGDKRLVSDYDFVLTMEFESMENLHKYAENEFHLEVRKEIGPMLDKTPVVYDFWVN